MFRGREMTHPDRGRQLLLKLADEVQELGIVESAPLQDGRNMVMMLAPHKNAPVASPDAAPEPDSEAAPQPEGDALPHENDAAAEPAPEAESDAAAEPAPEAESEKAADPAPAGDTT
jgi:translation initiation factor IF-3